MVLKMNKCFASKGTLGVYSVGLNLYNSSALLCVFSGSLKLASRMLFKGIWHAYIPKIFNWGHFGPY